MLQNATFSALTAAAPDRVFRHLAIAEAWPVWMRLPTKARRAVDGAPEPDGVGAVRAIFPVREQCVAYTQDEHYAYVMLFPRPIKGYRADVRLTPKGDGTLVEWNGQGAPYIPGTGPLVRGVLSFAARVLATLLVRHAARCEPGCPAHG
ncbi:polyketide cyclase/dehydrase/lipid transport protein [Actinocorallia herbida]|uniref:Polyketide cyclase/dehydrase/lipid transport protein n=1 Tax=Actinocorallia herbida TaxID=58109 RepID=A0A3N1D9G2_9ACTN|nr:SRPBCC family protein [Actinocorallia herbida]ROO90173.1 polyketide cyclase/dehydrase/lipid transport protein [Actinocorallia herbida]